MERTNEAIKARMKTTDKCDKEYEKIDGKENLSVEEQHHDFSTTWKKSVNK